MLFLANPPNNIYINCDKTVSCNCQDYDGSAYIGDLLTHTFQGATKGPIIEWKYVVFNWNDQEEHPSLRHLESPSYKSLVNHPGEERNLAERN